MAAQLTSRARGARGIALPCSGRHALRGIGDSAGADGRSWLPWASPLGWIQLARPFAGPRWWVLALPLAVLAAASPRRSTSPPAATRARACCPACLAPRLPLPRGSFGLAWRPQRGPLVGCPGRVRLRRVGRGGQGNRPAVRSSSGPGRLHQARRSVAHHQRLPLRPDAAGRLVAAGYATSASCGCAPRSGRPGRAGWRRRPAGSAGGSARSRSRPRFRVLLAVACWPPASATACASGRLQRSRPGSSAPRMAELPSSLVPAAVTMRARRAAAGRVGPGAWTVLARRAHRPVRPGSSAIPLVSEHLTVHARPGLPGGPCRPAADPALLIALAFSASPHRPPPPRIG